MDAKMVEAVKDLENRARELEIASSVHIINTQQLETNQLQLVKDISDIRDNDIAPIKEQLNLDIGKKAVIGTIGTIVSVILTSYLAWMSLVIIDEKMRISNVETKLTTISRDIQTINTVHSRSGGK